MSARKWASKKRHLIVDSIYNQSDTKPGEFCRRRERAYPNHVSEQQIQALEKLRSKRDLFM